mmetsp:Transcript_15021/g.21260  ORF Transcript_15021/g.21260 Transcript_15021/m.21260 type:complete len:134 (+) Transcript_15021:112-513(+)
MKSFAGFVACLSLLVQSLIYVNAFTTPHVSFGIQQTAKAGKWGLLESNLFLSSDDEQQKERLEKLGYSADEIKTSFSTGDTEEPNVAVTEVEIDPFTITAIGFGLIALNFLVFANMGDGGISGIVAQIINATT